MTYFYLWLTVVAMSQQSIFRTLAFDTSASNVLSCLLLCHLGSNKSFCVLILLGCFVSFKTKECSVINLRSCSSMQYDLSFNCLFNWWVYNEGICLIIELEESPGPLLLAILLVIPFWLSRWKTMVSFRLIWCPKSCVKRRLKHALGASMAQLIQKPCMCSVLLMSHQCTWLSHSPTNEAPSLFLSYSWPWFGELVQSTWAWTLSLPNPLQHHARSHILFTLPSTKVAILTWSAYFLPSPGLAFLLSSRSIHGRRLWSRHSWPHYTKVRSVWQDGAVSHECICRTALFVCGAVADVLCLIRELSEQQPHCGLTLSSNWALHSHPLTPASPGWLQWGQL